MLAVCIMILTCEISSEWAEVQAPLGVEMAVSDYKWEL